MLHPHRGVQGCLPSSIIYVAHNFPSDRKSILFLNLVVVISIFAAGQQGHYPLTLLTLVMFCLFGVAIPVGLFAAGPFPSNLLPLLMFHPLSRGGVRGRLRFSSVIYVAHNFPSIVKAFQSILQLLSAFLTQVYRATPFMFFLLSLLVFRPPSRGGVRVRCPSSFLLRYLCRS